MFAFSQKQVLVIALHKVMTPCHCYVHIRNYVPLFTLILHAHTGHQLPGGQQAVGKERHVHRRVPVQGGGTQQNSYRRFLRREVRRWRGGGRWERGYGDKDGMV